MRLPKRNLGNKWRSKKSEKRCAVTHSGRVQPGSGCLPVAALKGDVKTSLFIIDDKTTNRGSFSLNFALFAKLRREAFMNDKLPMIRIESQNLNLCVLEEKDLLSLLK
jgi:hypothetical protein